MLAEAAILYARSGLRVFPCEPRGKDPVGGHGHLDATTGAITSLLSEQHTVE